MTRFTRARLASVAFTGLILASAACAPAASPVSTASTPAPSADASVVLPSGDATPGTAAQSPSTAPASSAPSATSPSAAPTPFPAVASAVLRAYFFLGSFTGSGGLVPVLRAVPATKAVAAAAVAALLAGPTGAELAASPALYTDIPAGTRLLGLSISGSVASINLSSEFGQSTGSANPSLRLAQVVYTLTQFSTVTSVAFQLDGTPMTTGGGDRAAYSAELPAIFVDRPAWGAAAASPLTVSGVANVFEAAFRVQVKSASGTILADQPVMAACGTGCWGTFSATIPYSISTAQWGTLRVFDLSAKDGSPVDVTVYPVWLVPAG